MFAIFFPFSKMFRCILLWISWNLVGIWQIFSKNFKILNLLNFLERCTEFWQNFGRTLMWKVRMVRSLADRTSQPSPGLQRAHAEHVGDVVGVGVLELGLPLHHFLLPLRHLLVTRIRVPPAIAPRCRLFLCSFMFVFFFLLWTEIWNNFPFKKHRTFRKLAENRARHYRRRFLQPRRHCETFPISIT